MRGVRTFRPSPSCAPAAAQDPASSANEREDWQAWALLREAHRLVATTAEELESEDELWQNIFGRDHGHLTAAGRVSALACSNLHRPKLASDTDFCLCGVCRLFLRPEIGHSGPDHRQVQMRESNINSPSSLVVDRTAWLGDPAALICAQTPASTPPPLSNPARCTSAKRARYQRVQHLTIETNCAMLRAQARDGRDRAQSLMSSGVIGPSEAVRPQPQRRSDASRACAAGAARFPSLGTHPLTRAAPSLRLTHLPLVLTTSALLFVQGAPRRCGGGPTEKMSAISLAEPAGPDRTTTADK